MVAWRWGRLLLLGLNQCADKTVIPAWGGRSQALSRRQDGRDKKGNVPMHQALQPHTRKETERVNEELQ
jgi:hypothetical protein